VEGKGVCENVDGQPQHKAYDYKDTPALFDRIPVQEEDIDHGIDEPEEIQPVKYEHLRQYEEQKTQAVL
jgi:hypothetical protein